MGGAGTGKNESISPFSRFWLTSRGQLPHRCGERGADVSRRRRNWGGTAKEETASRRHRLLGWRVAVRADLLI